MGAHSRRLNLQDSKLSPALWTVTQDLYGGAKCHSIDLMARPFNAQADLAGNRLPFFLECPLPGAVCVNVFAQSANLGFPELFANPYVLPPICLIPHVLNFLNSLRLPYTIVVPELCPRRFWWPLLVITCSSQHMLAAKGSTGALLTPSMDGFTDRLPIPWDLWIFRITN